MEAQIEEEAKKEEVVQRSEEVQTIIDRMPISFDLLSIR